MMYYRLLPWIILLLLSACTAPRHVSVLIQMTPTQEQYFRKTIIPPFEKANRCSVTVRAYPDAVALPESLQTDPGRCILVKTPFEQTRRLKETGLLMAIDSASGGQNGLRDPFLLLDLATFDNTLYYLPRKFETRIMVYLKSKVRDAVLHWGDKMDEIDSVLKLVNREGLPQAYVLEENPNQWDYYDLFVVGYYWSRREPGRITPKIVHRGKRYSGTVQTLVDRIYQLGGDNRAVLQMQGASVTDMFQWEAFNIFAQVYNPAMWRDSLSGAGIWTAFKNGEAYLSFMTQLDCFTLHGDYSADRPGYVSDPDDLGYALLPQGVSLELDGTKVPLRQGGRSVSTGGWWWGIPKTTPDPALSVKLIEWISSPEVHTEESARFGMIPVRKDVLGDIGLLFGKGWITDVYETSFKQLLENQYTILPRVTNYHELELVYLDAWYDIAVSGGADRAQPFNWHAIHARLDSVYQSKVRAIPGLL